MDNTGQNRGQNGATGRNRSKGCPGLEAQCFCVELEPCCIEKSGGAVNIERKWPKNGFQMAWKWPKTGGTVKLAVKCTKVSFWAPMGPPSLILALFYTHWAVHALFWDLKTSIQGSGILFLRRSRALCLEKNGERFPTPANLRRKGPKKDLKWQKKCPKLHLSGQ